MRATVMVADDHPDNIDVLFQLLTSSGYQVLVADSGRRALTLIQKSSPDLLLLDVNMPDLDGFEVCRLLRKEPNTRELPVIFVTGRDDDVSTGFDVGGNDYVCKPFKHAEILARVSHQLERISLHRALKKLNSDLESLVRQRTSELVIANRQLREEVNERRFMQDRLRYLAEHDFVTRLYNRNALDIYTSELIAKAQKDNAPAWYLALELEGFRLVNESCGFVAGDELLREIGEILNHCAASKGFVARIGGDRFAVVFEHMGKDQVLNFVERVVAQLKQYRFKKDTYRFSINPRIAIVDINRNVASFEQLSIMTEEVNHLLRKKGDTHAFYVPALKGDEVTQGRKVDRALNVVDALNRGHFQVYVQRIINTVSQTNHLKFEALVRLTDPVSGEVQTPICFMPSAVRFRLVPEIDRWMVNKVCEFLGQHPELHSSIDCIGINLSAHTLSSASLVSYVQSCLKKTGTPANLLAFEVTETEQFSHMINAVNTLAQLTKLGCRIAIDDFGTGYASYSYIRDLTFDTIKIDGAFIRDIETNTANQVLVKSIVDISNKLGKTVVAEFVEREETKSYLQQIGVEWMQGYYFHKPEPLSEQCLKRLIEA